MMRYFFPLSVFNRSIKETTHRNAVISEASRDNYFSVET